MSSESHTALRRHLPQPLS